MARNKINSLSDESLQKLKRELHKSQNAYSNLSRRLQSKRGHEAVWVPASTIKCVNVGNYDLRQYQPVKIYGPWREDDSEPILTEWKSTKQMLAVSSFDGGDDELHMFHRWGVIQEDIAVGETGKIVIDGWTPCRTLYDVGWAGNGWMSAVPVDQENYCRMTRTGSCDLQFNVPQEPDDENIVFNYVCLNRHSQNIGIEFHRASTTSAPTQSTDYYSFASSTIDRGCNLASKDWTATGGSGLSFGNGRGVEALGPVVVSGNATVQAVTATFGTPPQTNNFECGYLWLDTDGSVLGTVPCTYSQGYYIAGSIAVRFQCTLHAWIHPLQLDVGQGLMFYLKGDTSSGWSGWNMDGTCKYNENWPIL